MSGKRFDVVVVGAGLVGAAFALAIKDSGLAVALLDRAPLIESPADETWDKRVLAISPGSASFLHAIGVWPDLPLARLQAVERMRVWGDGAGKPLQFDAYELGIRALAWIVEQRSLQAALLERLREAEGPGLRLLGEVNPTEWSQDDSEVRVGLASAGHLRARLVVGADGLGSWVRQAAGIVATPEPYGQSALVANFACERPHRGQACQWFLPGGEILALLPLPGNAISMVWSVATDRAQGLRSLAGDELTAMVLEASGGPWGALQLLGAPAVFPLSFLRLSRPIGRRLALIGDAAHAIHPLAGQGVNLGFGDAHALAEVLHKRGDVLDCGGHWLLERYARSRAAPVAAMQLFTHGLWRHFQMPDGASRRVRNFALQAAGKLGIIRRLLAQPALR